MFRHGKQALYNSSVLQTVELDYFGRLIDLLMKSGFTPNRHPAIYRLIPSLDDTIQKQLIDCISYLKAAGFSAKDDSNIFNLLFEDKSLNENELQTISRCFSAFNRAQFSAKNNSKDYYSVFSSSISLTDLMEFVSKCMDLADPQFNAKHHYESFFFCIKSGLLNDSLQTLKSACIYLIKNNFNFKEHQPLFEALSQHIDDSGLFSETFIRLRKAGFDYKNYSGVYQALIHHADDIEKTSSCLSSLDHSDYLKPKNSYIFNIIFKKTEACHIVFVMLNDLGFMSYSYEELFQRFFKLIDEDRYSVHDLIKMIEKLGDYCSQQPTLLRFEVGYKKQKAEIMAILDAGPGQLYRFGPLNKNQSTRQLESLLATLAETEYSQIKMEYQQETGYLLSINKKEYPLSLLLRHANLSHLCLDEELIERLGEIIDTKTGAVSDNKIVGDIIVSLLPHASQKALQFYKEDQHFNMNRLFRGHKQIEYVAWIIPVEGTDNLLVNFLCGCLVNDAANKLQGLRWQLPEMKSLLKLMNYFGSLIDIRELMRDEQGYQKMLRLGKRLKLINHDELNQLLGVFGELDYLFPNHFHLDRGEGRDYELAMRRVANTLPASSAMSFSIFKNGVDPFHGKKTTRIIMEENYSNFPVIDFPEDFPSEGEVILPQGEYLHFSGNLRAGFFASLVRSPDVQRPDFFWVDQALSYAYEHYLSQPYQRERETIIIQGIDIERPNHGLAHSYRVRLYIEPLIHYFAKHAKEAGFMAFCQSISEQQIQWLLCASAFRVTGRQCETDVFTNPELYQQYQKDSSEHFEAFIKAHFEDKPIDYDELVRMKNILEYRGNPNYEENDSLEGMNPREKELRIYLHRIMTIAHTLDLARCYEPEEYANSLSSLKRLSCSSPEQKRDYIKLLSHARDLIIAHGDSLCSDVDSQGNISSADYGYEERFAAASTSLIRVFELSEIAAAPDISPLYP